MRLSRRSVAAVLTAAVFCALAPSESVGQDTAASRLLGSRVRLSTVVRPEPVVGEVTQLSADSVQVTSPSGETSIFAHDQVVLWERSRGQVSRARSGMAWGAGLGFLTGAVGGVMLVNEICGSCDPDYAEGIALVGGAGLLAGGLVGLVVGSAWSREDWEQVHVGLDVAPPSHRLGGAETGVRVRLGLRWRTGWPGTHR